jgi:UDP-N-acetylglucosamine--N-acetylmuramyl-(pentapeptide) pyrophosphoryl-undecaprenol N-acetylglucosamine transferase
LTKTDRPFRLILTGGGTGGHVYPALATLAAARAGTGENAPEVLYVGSRLGLEGDIVRGAAVPFTAIAAGAIRGRSPAAALLGTARNLQGIGQAVGLVRQFRPDAVLATGGFVCVPMVLAARLTGCPTVVYLPDLRPGWAVRFLARVATVVAVSFSEVVPYVAARRVEVTGYPVRPELLGWSAEDARRRLDLPADDPIVMVLGGSRGAQSINEALARDLEAWLAAAWVLHVSGTATHAAAAARRSALPERLAKRYRLVPYLEADLGPALAAATLVVARSGASVLGELPAVGAASVLVPYPHAGAHQQLNARFLADRGAAVVVEDGQMRAGTLTATVRELLAQPARLAALSAAARGLARPDAAANLFRLIQDVASGSPRRRGLSAEPRLG